MPYCRWSARALVALLATAVAPPAMTHPPSPGEVLLAQLASAEEELLLEIEVNGATVSDVALLLRTADGRFLATAESLRSWRIRIPAVPVRDRAGAAWFPLDAVSGLSLRYDGTRQRLALTVPADAFESSRIDAARDALPQASVATPGGFLNYALTGTRGGGVSTYGALLEAGFFGPQGVVVAGVLAQRNDYANGVTRLDTTYTRDFPDRLETLRVGDAISAPGAWGRAIRFGGVQWGTNFALQPGFVTFPTFTARGETSLPSTVNVFVNNALVAQEAVPPGPFSIVNIPTITGAGDVQLVVRDLLGREVLISQPFYASSDLLAPGLSRYSLEVGAEREDYGIDSAGYGQAVASGTWRHGLTSELTTEIRGEATPDLVAAGGALDWLVGDFGVLSATAALSESKHVGTGWLAGAGFSHQSPDASVTLRGRWSSAEWRQAGVTELSPVPAIELAASASARLGRAGTISVAYVDQRYRERSDNEFATVGWSVPLTRGAVLGISGLRSFTERSTTISVAVTVPFGERDTASVGWYRQRDRDSDERFGQINVQRSLPLGEGLGYRVYARSERDVQAAIAWQGPYGTYTAEATRFEGSNAARLSISGGIGALGGYVFASREITESFGVVRVADYDDVRVLLENQPAARTSGGGYAVLPRLRAYDLNQIGIAQESLPLDATIGRLKVDAVPSYRSGVLIDFPVTRSRGATVTILLADGSPMPVGAVAVIDGADVVFPVGEGGLAYLSGLAANNRITVRHRGERCSFELPYPSTDDPLPDLGRVVCRPLAEAGR